MFVNSIEKLSSNLKKLIAIRDISSSDLAKELDIPMATLHRIINGQTQRPKKQIVKKLAIFFDISQDELIGNKEIEWGNVDGWLNTIININRTIPLCFWNMSEDDQLQELKNEETIILTNSTSEYAFALKIQDTSMEPLFPLNSIIICDPIKKPSHGSFVIICLNGTRELVLRKLLQDINIRYIKPLNKDFGMDCIRKLDAKDKVIATVTCVQHGV